MHAHITAFGVKLRLWEAQLANIQLEHFPRLPACVLDDVEPYTCVSVVAFPREEVASRFAGVRPLHGCGRQAVYCPPPLTLPWTTPCILPIELVELQCIGELKAKFYNYSPLFFFRDIALPSRSFPKCIAHVWPHLLLRTSLLQNEVHEVTPSLPALGPPSQCSSIERGIKILLHGKQHQPSHWFYCIVILTYCRP